jgi:hypothetical protein
VDLQLAYLAAPQNAAQVNAAQQGPLAAQQAAAAAFAAQVAKREETVAETDHAEGSHLDANPDGGDGTGYEPGSREYRAAADDDGANEPSAGEQHFIDFTA